MSFKTLTKASTIAHCFVHSYSLIDVFTLKHGICVFTLRLMSKYTFLLPSEENSVTVLVWVFWCFFYCEKKRERVSGLDGKLKGRKHLSVCSSSVSPALCFPIQSAKNRERKDFVKNAKTIGGNYCFRCYDKQAYWDDKRIYLVSVKREGNDQVWS